MYEYELLMLVYMFWAYKSDCTGIEIDFSYSNSHEPMSHMIIRSEPVLAADPNPQHTVIKANVFQTNMAGLSSLELNLFGMSACMKQTSVFILISFCRHNRSRHVADRSERWWWLIGEVVVWSVERKTTWWICWFILSRFEHVSEINLSS